MLLLLQLRPVRHLTFWLYKWWCWISLTWYLHILHLSGTYVNVRRRTLSECSFTTWEWLAVLIIAPWLHAITDAVDWVLKWPGSGHIPLGDLAATCLIYWYSQYVNFIFLLLQLFWLIFTMLFLLFYYTDIVTVLILICLYWCKMPAWRCNTCWYPEIFARVQKTYLACTSKVSQSSVHGWMT